MMETITRLFTGVANNVTRVTLALILATSLAFAHGIESPYKVDPGLFRAVCSAVEVNCSGIEAPYVVTTRLMDRQQDKMFTSGMYAEGEPNVYIHPNAVNPTATLVHELVHYILWEANVKVSKCTEEKLAFQIAGIEWTDEIRQSYGCFQPR